MPDVGGHSVIGGLLTGQGFTAVLPNLKVCARPKAKATGQVCTAVCKPGHQCLNQPFGGRGLVLAPAETGVVVDVLDIDRGGAQQLVARFDADVAKCTNESHCTFAAADEQRYGQDAAVEIAFGPVNQPTSIPPPIEFAEGPPAPAPTDVPPQRRCGDMTQGTFFDHPGNRLPLYADSDVEVWGRVTAYQNGHLVGGGGQYPMNDGITFAAKTCSVRPHVVQFVTRKVVLSDGRLLPGQYLTSDIFNEDNFAMSYPYTTDINAPSWHVDARTPLNQNGVPNPPYYDAGNGAGWCAAGNQLTTFDQPSVSAGGNIAADLEAFNTKNQTNLTVKEAQPFFTTFVLCGDSPVAAVAWHVTGGANGGRLYLKDSVNRNPQTLTSDLNRLVRASSVAPNRGRRIPIN